MGRALSITIESEPEIYRSAVAYYERHLAHLRPHVCFYLGTSTDLYPAVLAQVGQVDVLLLDGAPTATRTVQEFEMFAPYLKKGSILMAHDWDTDKMQLLRPMIESSPSWVVTKRLTAPKSVGFAVCRCSENAPVP
jgi:hypothetical protein